jgi:protein tyrosine/serine phosphatase
MPRFLPWLFGLLIVLLLVAGPVGYARYRQTTFRNFHVVKEGVLYRSGQMSLAGLKQVIHDFGIKTVVTLRDASHPSDGPPDNDEENYCTAEELTYVRIPPRNWWASDGSVPAEAGVQRFRDLMNDPANYPVLVHCFAGIHRTGAYCAVYRMEHDHWTNAHAITEMKALGYRNIDDEWDLLGYLEHYRPTWLPPLEAEATTTTEAHYQAQAKPARPVSKPHRQK